MTRLLLLVLMEQRLEVPKGERGVVLFFRNKKAPASNLDDRMLHVMCGQFVDDLVLEVLTNLTSILCLFVEARYKIILMDPESD